jgi:hypothetical protein
MAMMRRECVYEREVVDVVSVFERGSWRKEVG